MSLLCLVTVMPMSRAESDVGLGWPWGPLALTLLCAESCLLMHVFSWEEDSWLSLDSYNSRTPFVIVKDTLVPPGPYL